jgi:hypothetical protein
MGALSDGELIHRFQAWSSSPLWLVFSRSTSTGPAFSRSLAAKRGNDVYAWRLRERLDELSHRVQELVRVDSTHTNAVFVTLTDPHIGSRSASWLSIGERWNRFMANMRKLDPGVKQVRSWESTANGWPHIHALLVFPSVDFKTQLRWSEGRRGKPGRMVSRVNGTRAWRRYWTGHMDVQGCETTKGAVSYITKEVLKSSLESSSSEGYKGVLTQAICWASGRRSYSASRSLASGLEHSDASFGERPLDALKRVSLTQTDSPWELEGMMEGEPGEPLSPWVQHLDTLPEGLRRPRRKGEVFKPDETVHELLGGGSLLNPKLAGSLDEWRDEDPVYDEVPEKYRRDDSFARWTWRDGAWS